MQTLNMYMSALTPWTIHRALLSTKLEWRMERAQLASLVAMGLQSWADEEGSVETKEIFPKTKYTLFGIPVVLDPTLDRHSIELWNDHELLVRVEELAVPVGF